jgi:uncharacterized membrane protein YagU involved in acid resistance
MTTIQTPSVKQHYTRPLLTIIGWVGLLAGSLDILAACTNAYLARGTSPVVVLQYIASAAFGKAAFAGGWQMPLLGLLFHFIIAYSFTTLFFLLYPSIKIMSKSIVITAIVYGIFIFVIMSFVVLPLTKVPKLTFQLEKVIISVLILIAAIGLPLSIFARRFFQHSNRTP